MPNVQANRPARLFAQVRLSVGLASIGAASRDVLDRETA